MDQTFAGAPPGGVGVVEDDGSLTARCADVPGLADALLGRSLLDPLGREPLTTAGVDAISQALRIVAAINATTTNVGEPACESMSSVESASQAPSLAAVSEDPVGIAWPVDLSATVGLLAKVRRARNSLEAVEAVLLDLARRQGMVEEADFIDHDRLGLFPGVRREELINRAIIAEIALAVTDSHDAISLRMDQGHTLVARAPQTLASALAGKVQWRNAAHLADQVSELAPEVAAQVDAAALARAESANPGKFRASLRRIIERVHPTPAQVRHEEAATKRYVRTEPAADGMAYLSLFAPAVAVHAIWDRLTQTSRQARTNGDHRTLEQLRTDTAIALLLDDGTLDLTATSLGSRASTISTAQAPNADIQTLDRDVVSEPGHVSASDVRGGESCTAAGKADTLDCGSDADQVSGEPGPTVVTEAAVEPSGPWSDDRFSLARIARSIRPRVFVTVPVLSLIGACDEPALLDGQVPIDAETARELAGLATSFTRLLTDPYHGTVIGVDAKTYRPPAGLKHWIQLRDATCRFPGCLRRAVESDIDHNTEWSHGGTTTIDNLTALCRRHHSLKTLGAFHATPSMTSNNTTTGRNTATGSDTQTDLGTRAAANTTTQITTGPGAAANFGAPAAGGTTGTPAAASLDGPVLTWTSPTGRQYTTSPDPVPATCHPPGVCLPHGPTPPPDELQEDSNAYGAPPF